RLRDLKRNCVGNRLRLSHGGTDLGIGDSQLGDAFAAFKEAPFELDGAHRQVRVAARRRLLKIKQASFGNDSRGKSSFGDASPLVSQLDGLASNLEFTSLIDSRVQAIG